MQEILILLIATIGLSGFFSGAEVALVSVSRLKAKQLADQKIKNASYLFYLKENFSKTLITILIGNNLVNIGASALATKMALDAFGNAGVSIATGVMTFLILTFGEIVPKTFASKQARSLSLFISPIIYYLMFVFYPIVWAFHKFSLYINKFGKAQEEVVTEQELKYLISVGEQQGQIKPDEKEMIQNVLRFDDTPVHQVMTPRVDVFALDHSLTIKQVLPLILEQGFSRIPVYEDHLDKIKGVVVVKDILEQVNKKKFKTKLSSIMNEALFVPETKKIDTVLRELQRQSNHMAIVVNEHGGVEGVITIEDLLEEIVGEIFDESDEIETLIRHVSNKTWSVLGKTPLRLLNKRLKLGLAVNSNYNTIAGFLQQKLGKVPSSGDKYVQDKLHFTIKRMDGPTILEVVISKK